ncbi:MAG: YfhO family protein [Eubacterium sp.]|nr:YfhO family protein [Eubacterium sp.]
MSNQSKRWSDIRSTLYKNGYLLAAFIIPALLMYGCYATYGMQPYGEKSVLALDLNAQYVYYYDYIHDVIGNGESLFYSWSRNLSGEFFGVIGYYLASPFNIIVWLFPRESITDGLMWMILAKIGSCGLITALYLHKGRGLQKNTAVIFAPLYALCAYMVVQTMNPMWLDGVLILPLVCWGVDALVKENRFRLLVGALIYAFVTNFYIGFMIAIFTVVYFVAAYFANADYSDKKTVAARFVSKGALAGLAGVTAALCGSFMLIPVYYSLQNGKFDFTVPDYSLSNNFELIDVFRKLFVNSYDTVRMEGLPIIFCGSITLVLAGVYFFNKKIPVAKRLAAAGLLAVLVASMYIKPLDMLWHGGQVPNWLPYRYSFMISLILVICAAQAFERLGQVKARALGLSALFFIALVIISEGRDTFISTLGTSGREVFASMSVALPAIIFILIAVCAAFAVRKTQRAKRAMSASAVIILIALFAGEMSFNTSNTLTKMDDDIVFSTKESYTDIIVPLREKVAEIKADDDGFYRIEKTFYRTVNDPIATGMYGLSHSSSTLNARAINMLGCFGFTSNGHYTRFSGYTPLTADIFGVKYILGAANGRDNIKGDPSKITVTENPDALPIAYLSNSAINSLELDKDTPFANQMAVLSAMTGTDCSGIYTEIPAGEPIAVGCVQGSFADEHIGFTDAGSNASVTYTVTTPKDGDVYMYIPSDYEREVYVYVNGSYKDVLFESDNKNIKLLGSFTAGETLEVRLDLRRSDLYYKQPQFAVYDPQAETNAIAALNAMNTDTTVERISGTEVKISVNADTAKTLFTTIPYENGWDIYIDGKKTDPMTVLNGSLFALNVGSGRHTVEMKFTPAGYPMAIFTTLAGIALFTVMITLYQKLRQPIKLSDTLAEEGEGVFPEQVFEPEDDENELYSGEDGEERFSVLEELLNSRERKEKDDTDG